MNEIDEIICEKLMVIKVASSSLGDGSHMAVYDFHRSVNIKAWLGRFTEGEKLLLLAGRGIFTRRISNIFAFVLED